MKVGERAILQIEGVLTRQNEHPDPGRPGTSSVVVPYEEVVGVYRDDESNIVLVVPNRCVRQADPTFVAADLEAAFALGKRDGLWVATCEHCGIEIPQLVTWAGLMGALEGHHRAHVDPGYITTRRLDGYKPSNTELVDALRGAVHEIEMHGREYHHRTDPSMLDHWRKLARAINTHEDSDA